jgi:hypothetical protein
MTATRTVGDYEKLRAAVLGAEPVCAPDLGIIRRHGLAVWLKQSPVMPVAQQLCARTQGAIVDPAPATSELSRLIAGIVVALAVEPAYG